MLDTNTVSLIASATSIILALLAIILSVWFFVLSKKTEKESSSSLTKIETQADSLQKLTGKWMDRLTKYVTTDRPSPLEPAINTMFSQLPQAIIQFITQTQIPSNKGDLSFTIEQYHITAISLYFYSAQTNYWCQRYLPHAKDFDENNDSHKLIRRIIDTSYADFHLIHNHLLNANQNDLSRSKVYNIYLETKDSLAQYIRSVADIFILEQKSKENNQ